MQPIGDIGNKCGGLNIKTEDGKYYWGISTYWECDNWSEIPEYLYNALIKYERGDNEK